jgi:hypothetical protein
MMDKKALEELENSLFYFKGNKYEVAEYVIWLGYRKIPEGSVVLTREEWEGYCATQEALGEIMDREREIGRKETAEKFAKMLKSEYEAIEKELQQSDDEVLGSDLPERCVPDVVYSYGYIEKIDEICKEIIGDEK